VSEIILAFKPKPPFGTICMNDRDGEGFPMRAAARG
jgi:hypothetical protein